MSALGHKQTSALQYGMSALPPTATGKGAIGVTQTYDLDINYK